MTSNIQVAVRVRPLIEEELEQRQNFCAQIKGNEILLRESLNTEFDDAGIYPTYSFAYDNVFGPDATQSDVYSVCVATVDEFAHGVNGCIMAYGETSSGKSYTISDGVDGIVPSALRQVFESLESQENAYELTVSYLQIYNENLYDLLGGPAKLQIRENGTQIYVENLATFLIQSEDEALRLFQIGNQARKTAETRMNYQSSRSHAAYILELQVEREGRIYQSKLTILDLAGSEKAHTTQKERLRETKTINTSLTILSNVLNAILQSQTNPKQFIPYRDSKLTRLLQDSLGRNCKTTILVMISPATVNFSESLNSLKFGERAKQIKENAVANEVEGEECKILRYKREIEEIKAEIARFKASQTDTVGNALEDADIDNKIQISGSGLACSQNSENELIASLSRLEQEKCEILNEEAELNELRAISVDEKNIMIVLSEKMQEVENVYLDLSAEIEQIQRRIELVSARTETRKATLREKGYLEGDELSEQFIKKYELQSYIEQQQRMLGSQVEPNIVMAELYLEEAIEAGSGDADAKNAPSQAELNFDEKQEEMTQLSMEYEEKIAELEIKLENTQAVAEEAQDRLERLVDEMTADVALEQQQDAICVERLSECSRERALMLEIFREKVEKKIENLEESDCDGLKEYLLRVAEAIEYGELYGALSELFGAE